MHSIFWLVTNDKFDKIVLIVMPTSRKNDMSGAETIKVLNKAYTHRANASPLALE